jgi:fido (protein-threonine AMPylation protein)
MELGIESPLDYPADKPDENKKKQEAQGEETDWELELPTENQPVTITEPESTPQAIDPEDQRIAEFHNMAKAALKYDDSSTIKFSRDFFLSSHQDMFGDIWKSAGQKRTVADPKGIAPEEIEGHLATLVHDLNFWEKNETDYIHISAGLHHRLVFIRPFGHGNGRWARFLVNLYLKQKVNKYLQWPNALHTENADFKQEYVSALKAADALDFNPLTNLHTRLLQSE